MALILCGCGTHVDHNHCQDYCVCDPATMPQKGSVTGSYIEGRNLSKFDQDILKILCAVLRQTGPVTFNMKDIEAIDVDELVVEATKVVAGGFIASYGEVSGVS